MACMRAKRMRRHGRVQNCGRPAVELTHPDQGFRTDNMFSGVVKRAVGVVVTCRGCWLAGGMHWCQALPVLRSTRCPLLYALPASSASMRTAVSRPPPSSLALLCSAVAAAESSGPCSRQEGWKGADAEGTGALRGGLCKCMHDAAECLLSAAAGRQTLG